jgi:hypothetical protein
MALKQYGRGPGVDRVRVRGLDFEDIRELIRTKPDQITTEVEDGLREIGADAVRDMRERIEKSTTKTGKEAARLGHRPNAGRVRGAAEAKGSRPRIGGKSMRDSVDQEVKVNRRSISLRFGWLNGRPGYAFFQEYGTSNGVPAMHALTDAKANADVKLKILLRRL